MDKSPRPHQNESRTQSSSRRHTGFPDRGRSYQSHPGKKGTLDDFISALPKSERSFTVEEMNEAIAQADFSDCLILARNKSRSISPTHTLDRKAARLEGFKLL